MPLARAMRAWARQSRRQKAAASMAGESKQERAAACLLQEVTNLALMLGNEADDEVEAGLIQELMSRLVARPEIPGTTKLTGAANCVVTFPSIDRGALSNMPSISAQYFACTSITSSLGQSIEIFSSRSIIHHTTSQHDNPANASTQAVTHQSAGPLPRSLFADSLRHLGRGTGPTWGWKLRQAGRPSSCARGSSSIVSSWQ